MSRDTNAAGTSSVSIGWPNCVRIRTNRPLIELSVTRLPRTVGPRRPAVSSKLLGSADTAAPALKRIVLKVSVGRADTRWIGAKDCNWPLTSTCPPPYCITAWEMLLRNTRSLAESASLRITMPPHWPPDRTGPTPSLSPPMLSSW